MAEFLAAHWLDIFTTILGLVYILLEYRASIWLWLVGFVMPVMDVVLYWNHGLYGDAGMAVYYALAAAWGWFAWKFGKTQKNDANPTYMPARLYFPVAVIFFVVWAVTYYVLNTYTNSTVPVLDAFTNALSIVAMWALARKFIEQWGFWIIVDAVCCYLYIKKGIPFKALLYGLYVAIAVAGWRRWALLAKGELSESKDVNEAS